MTIVCEWKRLVALMMCVGVGVGLDTLCVGLSERQIGSCVSEVPAPLSRVLCCVWVCARRPGEAIEIDHFRFFSGHLLLKRAGGLQADSLLFWQVRSQRPTRFSLILVLVCGCKNYRRMARRRTHLWTGAVPGLLVCKPKPTRKPVKNIFKWKFSPCSRTHSCER
jgi:hypothetical protein